MTKFIFAFIAVAVLAGCSGVKKSPSEGAMEQLRSVNKIVLSSMSIKKVATLDAGSRWFGKRVAAYSYETYLRAVCDLSQLRDRDLTFDDSNMTACLVLPPVRIEVIGRDMRFHKEYDNIGLFRDSLDSVERAALKEEANRSMMKELSADGSYGRQLRESAIRKASDYFTSLLAERGYDATVEFR